MGKKAALCAILLTSAACGRAPEGSDSQTSYKVTGRATAGLTLKVTNEVIRICYNDPSNSDRHKEDVKGAVLEWVGGLEGHVDQPLTSEVQLVGPQDACDASVFVGNYAPAYTRMGSKPGVYINYSGWYGSQTVTLHEFGHAFGLLDTYTGRGGACEAGQPDSVMCRASYAELKDDDVKGIRRMYDLVRTGRIDEVAGPEEGTIVF